MHTRNIKILVVAMCLLLVMCLSCCSFVPDSGSSSTCNVTFVYDNGTDDNVVEIKRGSKVSEPTAPTKSNCTFDGWYTSLTSTQKYDFNSAVRNDMTLYAKYVVDYAALTNQITANTMQANVTVITKSYDTFLGVTSAYSTKSGSGIIYQLKNGKYYLLTNNHVTVKDSAYSNVEYTIEDYKGNTYKGTLISQNPDYDLAALYFTKSETLQTVGLAKSNPTDGTELVSLGQPKSQSNALTYGTLTGYNTVTLKDAEPTQSNVKFNVITHTCPINNGSSGGALLDTGLNLVGINFACGTTSTGEFVAGYAIPIEKVREFLSLYAGYNG